MKATEGGLLNFNNLNAFAAIFKLSPRVNSRLRAFSRHSRRSFGRRASGVLTWTHAEDLVKVSADAHLLVELRGLGQVGAGFEVRHGEDVRSALAGSWKRTKKSCFYSFFTAPEHKTTIK